MLKVIDLKGNEYSVQNGREYLDEIFKYLPEEVYERLCNGYENITLTDECGIYVFMQEAEKLRLLDFEPYIAYDEDIPILVLGWDRYLYFDRGISYKVACTPSLKVTYQTPAVRMDKYSYSVKVGELNDTDFMQAAYYINCLSAASGIPKFHEILSKNRELVDDFSQLCDLPLPS